MTRRRSITGVFTSVALTCFAATAALAQPYTAMGSQSGWNIFKNEATGGCFMERETSEGIVLQIGSVLTMTGAGDASDYGYLGIYVPGEAPPVSSENPVTNRPSKVRLKANRNGAENKSWKNKTCRGSAREARYFFI